MLLNLAAPSQNKPPPFDDTIFSCFVLATYLRPKAQGAEGSTPGETFLLSEMRPATALLGLIALLLPPPAAALPLTVAVILVPGFVDKVELPNSEPAYTGLAIQVFHAALDTICKTGPECWSKDELKYIEAENEGDNTTTGAWTGVLGQLQRGEADVGVGDINELLIRTRVVSFSGSWLEAPLAFLALPVTPPRSSYLWGWLRPFTPAVWLCLLALTALFAVSLAWLERWSPFSYRNLPPPRGREELRQRVNMKDTTHRAVNSLLGQGRWRGMRLAALCLNMVPRRVRRHRGSGYLVFQSFCPPLLPLPPLL